MAEKKTKAQPKTLTASERRDLDRVRDGADVYDYGLAMRLRVIERKKPWAIIIGKAMAAPKNGAARQPYFGTIPTPAALAELAKEAPRG